MTTARDLHFTLNGEVRNATTAPGESAIDLLRERCGLTGTKLVCGAGVCGACTVLVDGVPKVSCLLPAAALEGTEVTSVEGVGPEDGLHPVQRAFMAHDALQCGFCTPGFVVEAVAWYDQWRAAYGPRRPERAEIAAALAGHLCRCGAYDGIYRAVADACAGAFDDAASERSPRHDAREKVTGAARYTVDIRYDGQWEGTILRSPHAHARVISIDVTGALALDGVTAVAMVEPGATVRYVGHAVAAVAAADARRLRAALAAIRIVWEQLPAVVGVDQATAAGAPLVYRGLRRDALNGAEGPVIPSPWKGNIRGPSQSFADKPRQARRVIADARARKDPLLVEGTFQTGAQSHTSFEPHAAVARFDADGLTLHLSTQSVGHMARKVAAVAGLPEERVRVVAEYVGGGFGSKLALGDEATAAVLLARTSGRPVRVVLSREEELSVTGYRPATRIELGLLAGDDGTLDALSVHAWADGGVAINSTIAALARLIYPAKAKDLVDYDVVSHLPPASPFRGPGGPALCFALEQGVDEAAHRLASDPIALRQRWDPEPARQRLYRWAAGLETWYSRRASGSGSGRMLRGVGVAAANWLYWYEPGMSVSLAVEKGRLVVSTGTQDMGTGSRTVLARAVAESFGITPAEVVVRIGDSSLPEGPLSGGSRTTPTIVPPTLQACAELKERLGALAPGITWAARIAAAPDIRVTATRVPDSNDGEAVSPLQGTGIMGTAFDYILRFSTGLRTGRGSPGAVIVTEVEVDTWLGHVQVTRTHAGIAVGRIRARELAHSQVAGAVIQGIGHALHEERQLDGSSGLTLTAGLEDYRIPGMAEMPLLDVHFDEEGFDHVGGGGVGMGEVSTLAVAASVANAVYNATGRRVRELPLRPDRLMTLLADVDAR